MWPRGPLLLKMKRNFSTSWTHESLLS
jgi:hypothetical protein